jgi:hypothetical protein
VLPFRIWPIIKPQKKDIGRNVIDLTQLLETREIQNECPMSKVKCAILSIVNILLWGKTLADAQSCKIPQQDA